MSRQIFCYLSSNLSSMLSVQNVSLNQREKTLTSIPLKLNLSTQINWSFLSLNHQRNLNWF